jgi:AAA domain/DnaB-like helicase N terminal domain
LPVRQPEGGVNTRSAVAQPPHDLAAERCVLGAMLQSETAIRDVIELIGSSLDFYAPRHQLIHEAIMALQARGAPVEPVSVLDELRHEGALQRVGGAPYLHTLMQAAGTPVSAAYYARIVVEHATRRHLIELADRLRQGAETPGTDLGEFRELIRSQLDGHAPAAAASTVSDRLVVTPASQIPPRPVRWGWDDRLPAAHVGLIPGREGIGKSLFLIWLTAQITRGTLPGIYEGTPRWVFYAATEDSWAQTIVPRLIAAGADLELVGRVEVEDIQTSMRIELTLPRHCELLAAEVKQREVAMIALDPLMSVVDRAVDTYNDREMRTVLEPLARLADDTGCMIVGLAHFNKSSTDDPLNLVTGSRAFTAVVRAIVAIARDPDSDSGECVISQVKNNLGRLDLPNLSYQVISATVETPEGDARVGRLHFTGESARSVRDILADAGNGAERTERAECAEWLRQALAAGPCRTKEIEAEAENVQGFSKRTLVRARKQLGVQAEQLATGSKGRNEWWLSLPADAGPDAER